MHVFNLLEQFLMTPYIEVIKSCLPESRQPRFFPALAVDGNCRGVPHTSGLRVGFLSSPLSLSSLATRCFNTFSTTDGVTLAGSLMSRCT